MKNIVIGIGHPYRGDDALGPALIGALDLPVDKLAHHGEGTDLMERWQGYDHVIVVDAMTSGAVPGTIRVMGVDDPLPAFPKGSHVFGLAEAVEMARMLGRLPPKLTIIGVEAAGFGMGEDMSAPVRLALDALPGLIARLL